MKRKTTMNDEQLSAIRDCVADAVRKVMMYGSRHDTAAIIALDDIAIYNEIDNVDEDVRDERIETEVDALMARIEWTLRDYVEQI